MKRPSLFIFLGLPFLMASLLPGAATTTAVKKKQTNTTASSAASGKPASTRTASARSATWKKASTGSGRVVATRLVRTKTGRLTRVAVHAPPAPTFQTHPDPERYIEIQKALADRGFFKGEPNGDWGDDSVDALRRFQAQSNLPDDGKISALTLTGLGLGPRHDGRTASTVALPLVPAVPLSSGTVVPPASVTGSTVGPAASTPASPTPAIPAPVAPPASNPALPPTQPPHS